jgi:large subunit ribosomal protein L24
MHVKKGMKVRVISGNHKGLEGKILNVFPKKNRLVIEGINIRKRATRPTQENPSGGFVEREGSVHISNVMLMHEGKPTKTGFKMIKNGKKVRISKKTKQEVDQ